MVFFKKYRRNILISVIAGIALLIIEPSCYLFSSIAKEIQDDLVLYYDFNQNEGSFLKDNSDNDHNVSVQGAENFWNEEGVSGSCGYFTKGTKLVVESTRTLSRGSELTIMAWVRPESLEDRVKILSKRSYETEFSYYFLGLDEGRPYAAVADGENLAQTPRIKKIPAGKWTHLTMTLSKKNRLSLYINGKLTEAVDTDQRGFDTEDADLSVGSDFEGAEGFFKGNIDDLIILDKTLDAKAVKKLITETQFFREQRFSTDNLLKKPKLFMLSHWPLNEGRGALVSNNIFPQNKGKLSSGLLSRWRDGFLKKTLSFQSKDSILIKNFPELNFSRSFSFILWLNFENLDDGLIISKGSLRNKKLFSLSLKDAALTGTIGNGKKVYDLKSDKKIEKNKWYQVALIYDYESSRLTIGLNGKIIKSEIAGINSITAKKDLFLGATLSEKSVNASMADLKFFFVPLTKDYLSREYNIKSQELLAAEKVRKKREKVRSDLKKALDELSSLGEMLGEEDSVEIKPGKEADALSKVEKLIEKRMVQLKNQKQKRFNELNLMAKDLEQKKKELNRILKKLKQPLFDKDFNKPSEAMSIKELISLNNKMQALLVEINLEIKKKEKELSLKEALQKKRAARLKEQIVLNIKILNQLNEDLGKKQYQIQQSEMNDDLEKYSQKIMALIASTENEKKDYISSLKKEINSLRVKIEDLYQKISKLSEIMKEEAPAKPDVNSPLVDNVARLVKIRDYELKLIEQLEKKWNLLRSREKDILKEYESRLKLELNNIHKSWEELKELCGKMKTALPQINIPERFPAKYTSLSKLVDEIERVKKIDQEIKRDIASKSNLYFEQEKQKFQREYESLKIEFKRTRSKLLILNTELNISETWVIPKQEIKSVEDFENKDLKDIISKMKSLIAEREEVLRNKKMRAEEARRAVLSEIKKTVTRLNKILRELGLPEYPVQNPKSGKEEELLAKFKKELAERDEENKQRIKILKKKAEENKKIFSRLLNKLKSINKKLNKKSPDISFNEKTALKDIASIRNQLDSAKEQLTKEIERERASLFKKESAENGKKLDFLKKLFSDVKEQQLKLQELQRKLEMEISPIDPFPWQNDEYGSLTAYYQFEQEKALFFPDSLNGEPMETRLLINPDLAEGRYDKGIRVSSFDDYVFTKLKLTRDFELSINFWFKPETLTGNQIFFAINDGEEKSSGFYLTLEDAVVIAKAVIDSGKSTDYETGIVFNPGEWHHFGLIITAKYKKAELYFDGREVWRKRIAVNTDDLSFLSLGAAYNDSSLNHVRGVFDDLKIYSRALTEEEMAKAGLESSPVTYHYQEDFLKHMNGLLEKDVNKRKEDVLRIAEKEKERKMQQKLAFDGLLKDLNEYHKKLDEPLETADDFKYIEEDNKLTILKSRLRRAKRRHSDLIKQQEEQRKALLKKITEETNRLDKLKKALGKKITDREEIKKGSEEAYLKEIKEQIKKFEAELRKKQKDRAERLKYINEEMKNIHSEMVEVAKELNIAAPSLPELRKGKEEDLFSSFRAELDAMKDDLDKKKKEDLKRFTMLSSEIEAVWEELDPLLKYLKKIDEKPKYDKTNAAQVLESLKNKLALIQPQVEKTKQKRKEEFTANKKLLETSYTALQEVTGKLNESLSFVPDFSENNIENSIEVCKKLLKEKKETLNKIREAQILEQKKKVRKIKKKLAENTIELKEVYKKMGLKWSFKPLNIIELSKVDPKAYFDCSNIINDYCYDENINYFLRLKDIQVIETKEKSEYKSFLFNGSSSYIELDFNLEPKTTDIVTLALKAKANRLWGKKSIVFFENNKGTGIDVFFDRSRLKVREITSGKEINSSLGIPLEIKDEQTVWIELNLKSKKCMVSVEGANPLSIPVVKNKFSKIRLGSYSAKDDFFSGKIRDLIIINGRAISSFKKDFTKKFIVNYKEAFFETYEQRNAKIKDELEEKTKQLEEIKKAQEQQREKIRKEIETLKIELGRLTNNEKVIFSVVIGEEEKALTELKEKVKAARVQWEKKQAQEKAEKQKLVKQVEALVEKYNKQAFLVGKEKLTADINEGEEQKRITELKNLIKVIEAEKLEIDIKIRTLKNRLKRLYSKAGVDQPIKEKSDSVSFRDYIDFLNKEIKDTRDLLAKKQKEELLSSINNQYKILYSIHNELGEPLPENPTVERGQEKTYLEQLSVKIEEARKLLKIKNAEKIKEINKRKQKFELLVGQLKPIIRELGIDKIGVSFVAEESQESLNKIKEMINKRTKELEQKKAEEEKRLVQMKETAEGLLKAIEEEKEKIRKFSNELNIKNYEIPTVLDSGKRLKGLQSYYKFDNLENESMIDETGNIKESFITGFTEDIKVPGKFGFALKLNGLDQFLNFKIPENMFKAESFTLAFWFKPRRTYGLRKLFSTNNTKTNSSCSLYVEDGRYKLQYTIAGKEKILDTNVDAKRKEWEHVVFSAEKDSFSLYMNNTKCLTEVLPRSSLNLLSERVIIGSAFAQNTNLFAGQIDELKVYSVAVSSKDTETVANEEDLSSQVDDVDLLKEEYSVLKTESDKLSKKIKAVLKAEEDARLRKVADINTLIANISDMENEMGRGNFSYVFAPGEEDKALSKLNKLIETKTSELEKFRKDMKNAESIFNKKASVFIKKIEDIQAKLGNSSYKYHLVYQQGKEQSLLKKAEEDLKNFQEELEIYLKAENERKMLALRNEISEKLTVLNSKLTLLEMNEYAVPDNMDGREEEILKDINERLTDVENKIIDKERKEQLKKDMKEREGIVRVFRSLSREIESLQKEIGIYEESSVTKKDDPAAKIYLSFDDGRGNLVKDRTKYGNHATFLDYDFEWSPQGIYNKCISLPGAGGSLVVYEGASIGEINDFTMMFWLNPSRLYGNRRIFTVGGNNNLSVSLKLEDDRLIFGLGEKRLVDSGVTLKASIWQHLAITFEKQENRISLYLDGNLVSQVGYPGSSDLKLFLNRPIYIGSTGESEFYAGLIDEFKLFSTLLSVEEINDNKKQGIPKIDTSVETMSVQELKEKISTMDSLKDDLRAKKAEKEKEEQARRKQLLLENKVLREAKRNKELTLLKEYFERINFYSKQLDLPLHKYKEPAEGAESKAVDKAAMVLNALKRKADVADVFNNYIVSEWSGSADQGDKLFAYVTFDNADDERIPDNSGNNRGVSFSTNIQDWIQDGISGKALLMGDHGYLKIDSGHKSEYNLRQSLQLWLKPDKASINHAPVFERGNMKLEVSRGFFKLIVGDEVINFNAAGKLKPGKWTLVNLVINEFSSKAQLSLNKGKVIIKDVTAKFLNSNGPSYIGGAPDDAKRFSGFIDELKIFHRLLKSGDLNYPFIYNVDIEGSFSNMSHNLVILDIKAENADFIKVFQDISQEETSFEAFRSKKIIKVIPPKKKMKTINIILELKNRFSDEVTSKSFEIPLPEKINTNFIIPPEMVELTSR